jgi:hypothetical protein
MSYWEWDSKGSRLQQKDIWTFEASALGKQWLQATHLANGQRFIHGSDGQSVFWLFQNGAERSKLNLRAYCGTVFKGTYPIQSTSIYSTLPWLAYCSGPMMGMAATNGSIILPAPWLSAWDKPLAHIYRARYEPIEGGHGLPRRLEFWPDADLMDSIAEGNFHTVGVIDDSGRDAAVVSVAGYYRNIREPEAIYRVNAVKDYDGFVLPTDFSFEGFLFVKKSKDGAPVKSLCRKIVGTVASVEVIGEIDPLPRSSDDITSISVGDYRFYDAGKHLAFVGYTASNAAWLVSESDPTLQHLYKRELMKSWEWVSRPRLPRTATLIAFLLLVLAPLLSKQVRRGLARGVASKAK